MKYSINEIPKLSLRQLKAMLYVSRYKNLTRAAEELNRSQTAVTKSVTSLEDTLNIKLFDRSSTGMRPTVCGQALADRVANVEIEFKRAGESLGIYKPGNKRIQNSALFSMDISYKRMVSFIALYDMRSIASASAHLNITRAAIYNSLRQLEELLDIALFERQPNELVPTAYCRILARQVKLAFAELRHALEDIDNLNGVTSGHVVIGTLPYMRSVITPRAINRFLSEHPQLDISTRDGPYATLEALLRSGEISCILGAIRTDNPDPTIATEELFQDKLSVIVRQGHPLLKKPSLSLADLEDYNWILPARGSPSRQIFKDVLNANNLPIPEHQVSSSSLSLVKGLLMESNRLALLSRHQIYYDYEHNMLAELPINLRDTYRPLGITTRAQSEPSPAAKLFLQELRSVTKELFEIH